MKKSVFIISLFLIFLSPIQVSAAVSETSSSVTIKQGTFLKGFSQREISTAIEDIGDEVCFINSLDMYADETNAIPAGSKFLGVVEDIREPVQGTNAAIKMKITKIIKPDKTEIPVDAYVYSENDNYIGGGITPPMFYNKTPTYCKGLERGVLQYTPTNIRYSGEDTVIKAGTELYVIILEDLKINK